MRELAALNYDKAEYLKDALRAAGCTCPFPPPPSTSSWSPSRPASTQTYRRLLDKKIVAGLPLEPYYPELAGHYLFCVNRDDAQGGHGRPGPGGAVMSEFPGTTGLILNEPLLWEQGRKGRCGFSLPRRDVPSARHCRRRLPGDGPDFPDLSEVDVVRHYTRLSTWNFGGGHRACTRSAPAR